MYIHFSVSCAGERLAGLRPIDSFLLLGASYFLQLKYKCKVTIKISKF